MKTRVNDPRICCSAPSCAACPGSGLTRRGFLSRASSTGISLAAAASTASASIKDPARQQPIRNPLKVQPVFVHHIEPRRQATSWRSWGGIHTAQDAAAERDRIGRDLARMNAGNQVPLEILPLVTIDTPEQAAALAKGPQDVNLMYAANGHERIYTTLATPDKWNLMFVRHRSGPVYLYYETGHCRFLRKAVDEFGQPGMDVQDLVVDSHADVLMRLRALYGLKNALGKRIVAVGGPGGWGAGMHFKAPAIAQTQMKLDIRTVTYDDLGQRIQRARQNAALVKKCRADAEQYLRQPGVTLDTSRQFVDNAFLLTEVFLDLLDEHQTDAITIHNCMSTIMPMSETTACLPLSLLNDEGYMAFCESDFVVIPAGILLHYISGQPMFMNDPTYPHHNMITLAHCTGPRKMDGKNAEPVRIVTHFESDYGAAPKVQMRKGAKVTNLIPDFASKRWAAFEGEIVEVPFLDICRDQIDVGFKGDTEKLAREMRGFHWMTCYGGFVDETAYALKKLGVDCFRI